MMVETVVYDAQTGREEIKEIEETIEKPETPPEPSLEEKVQELQNNVLNLQSVLISQKISGGGITITDSSNLAIKNFTVQGKTEQESTTGKNLFDANGIDSTRHILGDLSGFSDVDVGSYNLSNIIPVREGESIVKSGTTGSSVVGFLGEDKSFLKGISLTDGKPVTVPAGAFYFCCNIAVANIKNKIQIEKSDTVTAYEQYTGGKLSPSVEYPQGIINAGDGGSVGIKVTGKNLFDISKLKIEHDDEKIVVKQSDIYGITLVRNFKENTRYTVSFESHKNDGGSNYVLFEFVYTDGSKSEWYANGIPKKGFTSVANKTIDYLWIRNPWKAYAEITKIQVEKGIERTEYEVYKEPQVLTIPLDRPMTKWDRLEKRDGVYGIVYKHRTVDDLATLVEGDTVIYGSSGNRYFSIGIKDANLNYDYSKVYSEVGLYKKDINVLYVPRVQKNSFTVYVSDTDTIETAKEHLYYKVIYETDSEEFVPLPEETQIALNNLHTNYPTTVITNSKDCEMEVEYIADTENYINKRFSELSASIVATQKALL